jgi:hypothetical protein
MVPTGQVARWLYYLGKYHVWYHIER